MNYNKLKATGKTASIKTRDMGGIKDLPEYIGPRGGKYYFDFGYFGTCNFDVYQERQTRDVCIEKNVSQ